MAEATPDASVDPKPEAGSEPAEATPSHDKGDLEARLRAEPDFAVNEYKKLQGAFSRTQQQMKTAEQAVEVARMLGNGDIEAGARLASEHLANYSRVLQDPRMAKAVGRFLETGRALPDDGLDLDVEPEEDPQTKEIRELRETVARLEGSSAKTEMRSHLESFFQSEMGEVLSPEEKGGVLEHLNVKIGELERLPDGRKQLRNLNGKTIRLLAMSWLDELGKLAEVGERIHLRKLEQKKGAATDVPSGISSEAAKGAPEFKSAREALEHAAREYGVDLFKPPVGR